MMTPTRILLALALVAATVLVACGNKVALGSCKWVCRSIGGGVYECSLEKTCHFASVEWRDKP